MRKVFGDQFKPVLTDRIARHFSAAKKGLRKSGKGPRRKSSWNSWTVP